MDIGCRLVVERLGTRVVGIRDIVDIAVGIGHCVVDTEVDNWHNSELDWDVLVDSRDGIWMSVVRWSFGFVMV